MKINEVLSVQCDLSLGVAIRALEKYEANGREATILRVSPEDSEYAGQLHKLSLFKNLIVQVDTTMKSGSWYIGDESEGYGSAGC